MRIRKAVVTAASPAQRRLPLQNFVDRDGQERSVLGILLEEIVRARVEEIIAKSRGEGRSILTEF